MKTRQLLITALVGCMALAVPAAVQAQAATAAAPAATAPGMIRLNLPENMELKALVDYVGQRQGINFLYDDQINAKRVTIKAPQEIPAASLIMLVESALRMKGLTISRTDIPNTMRIESASKLTTVSAGPQTAPATGPAERLAASVTRIFELKHAKPPRVEAVLQPFLSAPAAASVTGLAEHNLVIVTDYTDNMRRLEELVALVDQPGPEVTIRLVPVAEQEAAVLAPQVAQLLAGRTRAREGAAPGQAASSASVMVMADERTNRLMVVGTVNDVTEALKLIKELDSSLGMETKTYHFASASAEEVDRLAKSLIGELAAKRFYKSVIGASSNLLIVTAMPETHKKLDELVKSLDRPLAETQSPIRFFKLENAKATDVIDTLQSIMGDTGLGEAMVDGVSTKPQSAPASPPETPAMRGPSEGQVNAIRPAGVADGATATAPASRRRSVEIGDTRIAADVNSNAIIIVARPEMQSVYEKLIRKLDVRRPQVLIEATLVTIDTSDEFKFGVEFSKNISVNNGEGKVLTFSQFGLSTADPNTGSLTLKPGIGFNGALISTDIANVVLTALQHDSRVRIQSQPTILVNDNAKGELTSQQEEPFVTVNATSQVALNTFGGYSSAGTSISITPQIGEGENLKLEYEITASSFTGTGSGGVPPGRQSNQLKSEVTIPNGHTIILGGLTRDVLDDNVDRIPILGEIPILEYAFSSRRNTVRKTTLFVFIHAVILRADKFEDLKVLSGDAARGAGLPADFPTSEPVGIR